MNVLILVHTLLLRRAKAEFVAAEVHKVAEAKRNLPVGRMTVTGLGNREGNPEMFGIILASIIR